MRRLEELIREADFRKRREQNTWMIRTNVGEAEPLVRKRSLQRQDGQLTNDAAYWLNETPDLLPTDVTRETIKDLEKHLAQKHIEARGPHHELELNLLRQLDPIPMLQELISANPHLRLFRILPTDKLKKREGLWRIISAASEHGESWGQMRTRQRLPDDIFGGVLATQWPSIFVCAPLVARNQPLALVFRTAQGAQLIAITDRNFMRSSSLGAWPVGGGVTNLGGSGKGIYKSSVPTYPPGFADSLLSDSVRGANRLLEHLTNVTRWSGANNALDYVERNIAWSSALFGFETVMELAREWNTPEALWTAFRALTMLEGLWPNPKNQLLSHLLDPENVLKRAVSTFPHPLHNRWATDIADNYKQQVIKLHSSGELDKSIDVLCQVRNLVHGTGYLKKNRAKRLNALRILHETNVDLNLVKDVAVFWWLSVLFSPDTRCPPNADPFAP